MQDTKVAIVGGGLGGLSVLAGAVRAAVDQGKTHVDITVFEPNFIGPGLAYNTHSPDTFLLNHELDLMGSVNVNLRQLDAQDFFKWVRQHRTILQPLYPSHELDNPKAYVPRSMYGRYLQVRYEEIRSFAADHDMYIHESHVSITNIRRIGRGFAVTTEDTTLHFDNVVLATGNYFDVLDDTLAESGMHFRPSDYKKYVSDAVPDKAKMFVIGTGLFAYDAALFALDSGKYSKVILASRRGMLRKVRGSTEPYTRVHFTIPKLEIMAGGKGKPFRLEHLLAAAKKELEEVYGRDLSWKDGYKKSEVIDMFRSDLLEAQSGRSLPWRSVLSSVSDAERHEIFAHLHKDDKRLFLRKYASLYNLFLAPMPSTNAKKVIEYIDQGKIEIVNGMQSVTYQASSKKFVLKYAHYSDGTPVAFANDADGTVKKLAKTYPVKADVCVDARGMGRDISKVPLYAKLIDAGVAVQNQLGGIEVDLVSHQVVGSEGETASGLYALGHMTCGETIITHNSLQMAQLGIEVGVAVIANLSSVQNIFSLREHYFSPDLSSVTQATPTQSV